MSSDPLKKKLFSNTEGKIIKFILFSKIKKIYILSIYILNKLLILMSKIAIKKLIQYKKLIKI
jgi:hypothetical protein